jgi:hypothetical protein
MLAVLEAWRPGKDDDANAGAEAYLANQLADSTFNPCAFSKQS